MNDFKQQARIQKRIMRWSPAIAIGVIAAAFSGFALADYIIKDGNGANQTIKAFVCETTKICPAHALIGSDGLEKGLPANPLTTGRATVEVCVTPTVTSGSAYTAGNVVGGLITLANYVRAGQLTGELRSVRITSRSIQTAEFDVTLLTAAPTATFTDKTAPVINPADTLLVQPPLKLTTTFSGLGTHTVYGQDNIGRAVKLVTTSGYVVITTPGTPTFTSSSDLQICVAIAQD